DPAGAWTNHTFGTGSNCHNRPIAVIDETARRVHMFATGPQAPAYSCDGLGAIYEKSAPLDNISFAPGYGTPVIQDDGAPDTNNVAGSKHNVTSAMGIVALAINKATNRYWHHWNAFAPPSPPAANFTGSPTSGSAPLTVSFTDTSTGAPTSWSWNFGDGGTSAERSPSHTYAAAGTYTVSLTASNVSGSDTETKTGYITVGVPPPPNADFTGSPTSGSAPLTVSFTDTSTGAPTSWSWNFGDTTTSSDRNPSHTYTLPGLYTVSLTATNASGSDTETKVAYVNVGLAPSTVTVRPEADAHVTTYNVAKNYGTVAALRVREDPTTTYRSYLKFTVSGIVGVVSSAKLRLYVTDASPDGGAVYLVGNEWTETGITWNSAPPIAGAPVASTGSVALNTWVEVDVTAAVSGNGTYSFALKNASTNSAIYSSREGTQPPELVLTLAP
ncbi:MAG: PKD domain-containing protein, partial [Actinomycetota bacterium]|nr:PKD domain-containing protein [Actinomycetota bacterium]